MKLVTLGELKARTTPAVFAVFNPDEEDLGSLYLLVPTVEAHDLRVVDLGAPIAATGTLDNIYEMMEAFNDGESLELEWDFDETSKEHVVSLMFTGDAPIILLYSKKDIQTMLATLASVWKTLPEDK